MSETVYQNLKNKLEQLYQRNFAVKLVFMMTMIICKRKVNSIR